MSAPVARARILRDHVRALATDLEVAIRDRREEQTGRPVQFLCDADVVLGMVLGFFGEITGRPAGPVEVRKRVVRSAMSVGCLGELRMLDAHAIELLERIDSKPDLGDMPRGFNHAVLDYVQREGVADKLETLADSLPDEEDPQDPRRFFSELTDSGDRVFSALEHLHGHWRTRLRRLVEREFLDLRGQGEVVSTVLGDRRGDVVAVLDHLERARRRHLTPNLRDAVAIVSLMALLAEVERRPAEKRPLIRFYTETRVVRELFDLEPWSARLRDAEGRTVARDRGVLFLRAGHRALRPGGPFAPGELDDLERIVVRAKALLEVDERRFAQVLEGEGREVVAMVRHFQQDPVVETLIASGGLPERLGTQASEWTAVYRYARSGAVRNLFKADVEHVVGDLQARLGLLQTWLDTLGRVGDAVERLRPRCAAPMRDPLRDLGLTRWNTGLSPLELQRAARLLQSLLHPGSDAVDLRHAEMELTDAVREALESTANLEFALLVLFGLTDWDLIRDVACRLPAGQPLPSGVAFLVPAARIRSFEGTNGELGQLVEEVERRWATLDPGERARQALGYGYALFHAWRRVHLGEADEQDRARAVGWATGSYRAVQDAMRDDPLPDSHTTPLRLNHLLYVGLKAQLPELHADEVVGRLVSFVEKPSWNYRFADTMAFFHLIMARRVLFVGSRPSDRDLRDAGRSLTQARVFLDEVARASPIDLEDHREREAEYATVAEQLRRWRARPERGRARVRASDPDSRR